MRAERNRWRGGNAGALSVVRRASFCHSLDRSQPCAVRRQSSPRGFATAERALSRPVRTAVAAAITTYAATGERRGDDSIMTLQREGKTSAAAPCTIED